MTMADWKDQPGREEWWWTCLSCGEKAGPIGPFWTHWCKEPAPPPPPPKRSDG